MQYRSVLTDKEIRKEARAKAKGNRFKAYLNVLLGGILTFVLLGLVGFLFLGARPSLVPPFPPIVAMILNIRATIAIFIDFYRTQFNPTFGAIGLAVLLIIGYILGNLWYYGTNWAHLDGVDGKKFRLRTVYSSFTHRPIRHYGDLLVIDLVKGILTLLYAIGATALGFGFYVTLLTVLRGNVNMFLGYGLLALYTIIMILILLLYGLFYGWVVLGYAFIPHVFRDNEKASGWSGFRVSRTLTSGNKWQIFRLKFHYYFLPIVVFGVLEAISFVVGPSLPFNFVDRQSLIVLISLLFLWVAIVKEHFAMSVMYRDLSGQYARRLNEKFSHLHFEPKEGLEIPTPAENLSQQETLTHPTFSSETTAIQVPDEMLEQKDTNTEEDLLGTTSIPVMAPLYPEESESDEEVLEQADPGYPLEDEQSEPVPAEEIFSSEDQPTRPSENTEENDFENQEVELPVSYNEEEKPAYTEITDDSVLEDQETSIYRFDEENPLPEEETEELPIFPLEEDPSRSLFDAAILGSSLTKDKEDEEENEQVKESPSLSSLFDAAILDSGKKTQSVADVADKEDKRPYDPYGYNTPKKTDFSTIKHVEEVLASADRAQSSADDPFITPEDLQEAKDQIELGKEIEAKEANETDDSSNK